MLGCIREWATGKEVNKIAERRMFSKKIVSSARFLRMPATARLLYYDLGMYADDDGIVEAFTVAQMTHAAIDDLQILSFPRFY